MILLDTHVLFWLAEGNKRLGAKARQRIAVEIDAVYISAMSFWEIATLIEKQRMTPSMPLAQWREQLLGQSGIKVEPIDAVIASDAGALPGDIHGDPSDRIIIATARALGCPLLTVDRRILAYAAQGHVQAVDATR